MPACSFSILTCVCALANWTTKTIHSRAVGASVLRERFLPGLIAAAASTRIWLKVRIQTTADPCKKLRVRGLSLLCHCLCDFFENTGFLCQFRRKKNGERES